MSTLTLMRVYLKYQSLPRLPLPCIGYTGILYTTSLIDQQRFIFKDETGRTTGSPELIGTSNIVSKKGCFGSYFFRRYSTTTDDIKKAEKERQDKNKFKLKTAETVKVMVVLPTGSLSAMTLEEANKLAKKKNMKLAHITNAKDKPLRTDKQVYKLVSKLEYLDEEPSDEDADAQSVPFKFGSVENRNKKEKELKTVLMKSNIGEHDANARISNMKKWIKKGHRVRIVISQAGDKGNAETVFKTIETQMTEVEGQIQQKISKGNEIRFYVGPPKKAKSNDPKPSKNSQEPFLKVEDEKGEEEDDYSDSDDEDDEKRKRKSRR